MACQAPCDLGCVMWELYLFSVVFCAVMVAQLLFNQIGGMWHARHTRQNFRLVNLRVRLGRAVHVECGRRFPTLAQKKHLGVVFRVVDLEPQAAGLGTRQAALLAKQFTDSATSASFWTVNRIFV